ncbi:MAG: DUF4386 domain-containing protein [Deltaproteobacteria bacterium]|nr:DUF4386 domain-containing protein [Deltaproteobacteria bacterium]
MTTQRSVATPPVRLARLAGVLYGVPLVLAPLSMMYVPSVTQVPGDAVATAAAIVAHEGLFRLGIFSDMLIVLSEIALSVCLYALLCHAGQTLARAALCARLAMTTVQAGNVALLLAALRLARLDAGAGALTALQRQGLVGVLLDVHAQGVLVWQALFALHCAGAAVLIARSGWFPRALGWLMGLAAMGYALNGLASMVYPQGAVVYGAVMGGAALVGEVPWVFWLVIKGAKGSQSGPQ